MESNAETALSVAGAALAARGSGALWWPGERLLAVADLHLGKSERTARRGGALLPPYEVEETLGRLAAEVDALGPRTVILLGDSFDDGRAAEALAEPHRETLARLAAGRDWVWIAGNHDPGPLGLPGSFAAERRMGPLVFRHVPRRGAEPGEVAGHMHPKAVLFARGRRVSRRCLLEDGRRAILPAFGAYAGGLDASDPAFDALLGPSARALLTGGRVTAIPRAALASTARAAASAR